MFLVVDVGGGMRRAFEAWIRLALAVHCYKGDVMASGYVSLTWVRLSQKTNQSVLCDKQARNEPLELAVCRSVVLVVGSCVMLFRVISDNARSSSAAPTSDCFRDGPAPRIAFDAD